MENTLNLLTLEKGVAPGWVPFVVVTWHDVEMCSFCLLSSMELVLIQQLIVFGSSDMNSFDCF